MKPATLEYFAKQEKGAYGLRAICKVCNKAYDAARASLKNERKKERRRTNPEAAERMRLIDRRAIKRNAAIVSARKKAYYAAHPEQRRVEAHRRRARERAVGGNHTRQDVLEQYKRQKGRCYYCFQKVGSEYEIDHVIPISRGGTNDISNIVIACTICNGQKANKLPHEWVQGGRLL